MDKNKKPIIISPYSIKQGNGDHLPAWGGFRRRVRWRGLAARGRFQLQLGVTPQFHRRAFPFQFVFTLSPLKSGLE